MKKIGLIMITIIGLLLFTNVSAKEYSSDFIDYKFNAYVDDNSGRDGYGAFSTPIHRVLFAYFTSNVLNGESYLNIRLKLNDNMPEFVYYIATLEVYDANKNLIKSYEGLKDYDNYCSISTPDIKTINPKYYKLIINYLDDFFLENDDYKKYDCIIEEMETGIVSEAGKYSRSCSKNEYGCSYFLFFENYKMYIKKGKTFIRTIPKIYTNPETNERFKINLVESYYNTKYHKDRITEDDNNYYYTVVSTQDILHKDRIYETDIEELLFTIEPLDNMDVMMVPIFFSMPEEPIRKLSPVFIDRKNQIFAKSKYVSSESINKKGFDFQDHNFRRLSRFEGKAIVPNDNYSFTKDDYIYIYYYGQNALNLSKSNSKTTIIIIAIVGVIIAVIAFFFIKNKKKPAIVGQPNIMNRPPMNPNNQPNMMNRPPVNPNMNQPRQNPPYPPQQPMAQPPRQNPYPPQQGYGQPPMNNPYGQNNNPSNRI